ncbi:MAG TPA: O-antigen ligase family protein, partial [Blastocatellia bacterium]|nr:O-antigen ligase family protein [Blastocatellia bacterium]
MSAEMRRTTADPHAWMQSTIFWLAAVLLATVPLTIVTKTYRTYSLPRFALLLLGASILVPLLLLIIIGTRRYWALLKSWHVGLISQYLLAVAISSVFAAAPYISILGSFEIQMGLVTHLCFFVCFIALVVGIGDNPARFRGAVWAMVLPGLVIALYALAQSAAFDPFVPPRLYTYGTGGDSVIRAVGTLGHPDFLGNFLLYTAPLSAALAFASAGRPRRIAFAGTVFSVAAIALSGTRGAWVGLGAGAVVFATLQIKSGRFAGPRAVATDRSAVPRAIATDRSAVPRAVATGRSAVPRAVATDRSAVPRAVATDRSAVPRAVATGRFVPTTGYPKLIRGFLVGSTMVVILVIALSFSHASHGIVTRAKSFVSERLTGAGRTLLWRDSLGMVRAYPLLGCGAEAFRKTFLPYKSAELARMTGNIQNESSHNSYLDAAISYGIPGVVFYVALIASSLALLLRARRQSPENQSILLTGVISAFVAVIVHKIFIFDQISTGLYFFAFAALALSASNLNRAVPARPVGAKTGSPSRQYAAAVAIARVVGVPLLAIAVWYSASLLTADFQIRAALESASEADYKGLLEHGKHAANAPDPSGGYHFLFARALADYADRVSGAESVPAPSDDSEAPDATVLDLAMSHARKSSRHGISPDSSYVLLCYLSSEKKDYAALRAHATEAVRLDSLCAPAHSFLAEAYLGMEDEDGATRELAIWLGLIGRPPGEGLKRSKVQEFIDSSHTLAERGHYFKARLELLKGTVAAADACSGCHIALAFAYEESGFYE